MASRPPIIEEKLVIKPPGNAGVPLRVWTTSPQAAHLKELARWLGLQRPNGSVSVELLLNAIATGKVGVVRMDDAAGRVFAARQMGCSREVLQSAAPPPPPPN